MALRISMSPPPDGVFVSTPKIVGWTERTYRLYTWVKCLLMTPIIVWCHYTKDSHHAMVYCNTLPLHDTFLWIKLIFFHCEVGWITTWHVYVNFDHHIEAETKWPPFRRRYSQMHFLKQKILWNSNDISLKWVYLGIIDNVSSLIQIMALYRIGEKPLSEHMIV